MAFINGYVISNYTMSLLVFNIFVYIMLSSALFIILLVVSDKTYSTLNKLKYLQEFHSLFIITLLLLLSLAGIPPLLGFIGKFMLYIQLLAYKSFYLFTLFLLFNVFILYFYIQNIRFMVSKNNSSFRTSVTTFNLNYEFFFATLIFITFFNVFGIFYFESVLNYLNFWVSLDLNL